jgi:membrane protease YdiL (CAAX protease family)
VFVVNIGLAWVCRWLMGLVSIEAKAQAAIETLRTTHSPAQVLLVGITAILLAPVAEEVLFRGILYPSIKQAGFPQLALWGSAVIFAATHANLMTFVPLTFFAIAQCLLYERTANLAAPIAAHSLFNIINFVWVLSER